MMARRLKQSDFDVIVEMRERGKTYEQIGNAIVCSASTVSWHCLRLGADPPKTWPSWKGIVGPAEFSRNGHIVRRFTAKEDELLIQLDLQGLSILKIAKRLGRPWNSTRGRLMTLARRDARAEDRP
jgi:hypothetical protein